jgi:hypothetical protein
MVMRFPDLQINGPWFPGRRAEESLWLVISPLVTLDILILVAASF